MKGFLKGLRWYHATRAVGTIMVLYELIFAVGTSERGTIILVGAGMAGFDFVARREIERVAWEREREELQREREKKRDDG